MIELLQNIFSSLNAFDEPFQPSMQSHLLLYPTDGFLLKDRQFAALACAASAVGEREAICVATEFTDLANPPEQFDCARFDLASFSEYSGLRLLGPTFESPTAVVTENAIVSVSGIWGVLVSQEFHAVLGGPAAFVDAFKTAYGNADADWDHFVEAWRGNAKRLGSDISWIPKLKYHLSGTR